MHIPITLMKKTKNTKANTKKLWNINSKYLHYKRKSTKKLECKQKLKNTKHKKKKRTTLKS